VRYYDNKSLTNYITVGSIKAFPVRGELLATLPGLVREGRRKKEGGIGQRQFVVFMIFNFR